MLTSGLHAHLSTHAKKGKGAETSAEGVRWPHRSGYCSGQHSLWRLLQGQLLGEDLSQSEGPGAHRHREPGQQLSGHVSARVQTGGRKQG